MFNVRFSDGDTDYENYTRENVILIVNKYRKQGYLCWIIPIKNSFK
jgi:hypothetical protein